MVISLTSFFLFTSFNQICCIDSERKNLMTDVRTNNILVPGDIFAHIASYLTVAELARFKQVCQSFNHIASGVYFLQPIYNRLYKLDKTLPPTLNPETAVFQFKSAFEQIKKRQNEEIAFLNEMHIEEHRDDIDALLSMSGNTVEELEGRNLLLDKINVNIINAEIVKQPGTQLYLSFSGITRFIITQDNVDYFKKIEVFSCDVNLLSTLDLSGCSELRTLFCSENKLTTFNLKGLKKLQILWCQGNQLNALNLADCPALEEVCCHKNQLTTLNLMGCTLLRSLMFHENPLTCLNLEGTSQIIKDTYSKIEEELLFKQLSSAAFFERAEIIKKLGERRYTAFNCLKYGCFYEAGVLASSLFLPGFSYQSKGVEMQKEEATPGANKRKREEGEEALPDPKRCKLNGA